MYVITNTVPYNRSEPKKKRALLVGSGRAVYVEPVVALTSDPSAILVIGLLHRRSRRYTSLNQAAGVIEVFYFYPLNVPEQVLYLLSHRAVISSITHLLLLRVSVGAPLLGAPGNLQPDQSLRTWSGKLGWSGPSSSMRSSRSSTLDVPVKISGSSGS